MAPGSPSAPPGDGRKATRRRLPAAERRVLILDAALRAFASHGYDGAAMDDIAAAAGVSKAVVYDHVASKRDLYMQLLDTIRLDLEAVVEQALDAGDPPGAGEPRVRAGVGAFFQFVEQHPQACRLLLLELQGANVSAIGRALEERITNGLAETLGTDPNLFDGHPDRDRQLVILAELLKAAVHGLASWWYRHPDAPREDLVDRTVALIWPAIVRA